MAWHVDTRLVLERCAGRSLGAISLPADFGVRPGKNELRAITRLIKDGTRANADAIDAFVAAYSMGTTQLARVSGPVGHPNPLLDGFLDIQLSLAGIPNPNLVLTSLLTKQSIGGFKPKGSSSTLRGAVAVASNPFAADVVLSHVL